MPTQKKVLPEGFKNVTSNPLHLFVWGEPQDSFLKFEFPAIIEGVMKIKTKH